VAEVAKVMHILIQLDININIPMYINLNRDQWCGTKCGPNQYQHEHGYV
jgi:hypothetical protein